MALFLVLLLAYLWFIAPDDNSTAEKSNLKSVLLADGQISIKVPEDWKIMPKQSNLDSQSRTPELHIVHNPTSGMVLLDITKLPVLPIERLSKERLRYSFGSDDLKQIKKNYGSGKFVYTVVDKNDIKPEKYISKVFKVKEDARNLEFDFKNGKAIGFSIVGTAKDSEDPIYMKIISFFIYDRVYTMRGISKEVKDKDAVDRAMEELFKSIRWNGLDAEKSNAKDG